MKRFKLTDDRQPPVPLRCLVLLVAVLMACALPPSARAVTVAQKAPSGHYAAPGANLAHAISEITGVAISPLLGASAVGVWRYFHTSTPAERARLPWFAQPWFWVPGFLLAILCILKDSLGVAAPPLLKKPFDVLDAAGHKVSGLIATGAFVPLVMSVFQSANSDTASLGAHGFLAAIDLSWLGNALLVPVGMVVFFVVFLASNSLNVLILLSPFGFVDAGIKAFRGFLLMTVAGTALANPWLGAAWALVLIVIAYFIAGWSSRLSFLGLVFIWDFFTLRRKRFVPGKAEKRMFLARKISKVPARTYGTLSQDGQGNLALRYRPWLVLPPRTLTLPQAQYAIGRGMFYSQIVRLDGEGFVSALLLPPRYRGHEEELVTIYGLAGVREAGLRAAWRWLKDALGVKAQPEAAPVPVAVA
ncbi:MAG TPA: hypothetical protein VMU04_10720 [Candidatus Acidoferrum sp.]|nr:hypothetical protein [Candidatus Acidoferrum sp.]